MTEIVTGPDDEGVFHVRYEPPESSPIWGECGEDLELPVNAMDDQIEFAFESLHAWAREKLPSGIIYEIRGMVPTSNMAANRKLAWYHIDRMAERQVTGRIPWPGKVCELGGYILHGVFRTP